MKLFKSRAFLIVILTIAVLIEIAYYSKTKYESNYLNDIIDRSLVPFQKVASIATKKISDTKLYFSDMTELKKKNEKLEAKVNLLERQVKQLPEYIEQTKILKEALNIKQQLSNYNMLGANIISKDMGNWFFVFTVDRGEKDGVKVNSAVISNKGLVGRVFEVGSNYAKIISIIDDASSVSARISRTRDLVVVKGNINLKNEGTCLLDYIPADTDVAVGDMVETSGIGGVFPKDLAIGKVKNILKPNGQIGKYAIIEPYVDFRKLEEVFILQN